MKNKIIFAVSFIAMIFTFAPGAEAQNDNRTHKKEYKKSFKKAEVTGDIHIYEAPEIPTVAVAPMPVQAPQVTVVNTQQCNHQQQQSCNTCYTGPRQYYYVPQYTTPQYLPVMYPQPCAQGIVQQPYPAGYQFGYNQQAYYQPRPRVSLSFSFSKSNNGGSHWNNNNGGNHWNNNGGGHPPPHHNNNGGPQSGGGVPSSF
jgi:hypothetical protein